MLKRKKILKKELNPDKEVNFTLQRMLRSVNQHGTHLPDCIVFADHRRELPFQATFQGVLMFLDISGFTALCESFSNTKNGTDRLTKTLNGYMAALVGEILCNDGDVLKFAGDAILTLWKVDSYLAMRRTIAHVIRCAVQIQKSYGEWKTSVGITLRVKIGISSGEVNITYVGNREYCHYVTLGRAVESVNRAEGQCVSGDIVVSPAAWCHCAGMPIEFKVLTDGKHVKVTSYNDVILPIRYDYRKTVPRNQFNEHLFADELHSDKSQKLATRLRLAILENDGYLTSHLRLYVSVQVIRKLDEKQPLEYLSEMRLVTVVFINLQLYEVSKYELSRILQESFKVIYSQVKPRQGNLNKIFMFDKGCTFLAVFGLPGFKHESDCAHALFCASHMKKELDKLDKIKMCSIGVTTGSIFCGVVGHLHRHEYTVIGRKVNMAARLMMYYPQMITCDNETFHHSKLHRTNFNVLEPKVMKGLSNVGTIRMFNESKGGYAAIEYLKNQDLLHPLIGRKREVTMFSEMLTQFIENSKTSQGTFVTVTGEAGYGRTRFLDHIIVACADANCHVVFGGIGTGDNKMPFSILNLLFTELLNFGFDMTAKERAHTLIRAFQTPGILEKLYLLNKCLHIDISTKDKKNYNDKQMHQELRQLITKMMKEFTVKHQRMVFVIDDCQNLDQDSWKFLPYICCQGNIMVVASFKSSAGVEENTVALGTINSANLNIRMRSLLNKDHTPLACQMLGVVQIPVRLEMLLEEKSQGAAAWTEQLLQSMCQEGTIILEPLETAVFTEKMSLIYRIADLTKGEKKKDMVALISSGASLTVKIPTYIRGTLQAAIDRMPHTDQLILKTAAVLGKQFPLEMLISTVPSNISRFKLDQSLTRLARQRILERRASVRTRRASLGVNEVHPSSSLSSTKERCNSVTTNFNSSATAISFIESVQYDPYKMIKFVSADTQEIAYDMFLQSVRIPLHVIAANYAGALLHKCITCGGGFFLKRTMNIQDYSGQQQTNAEGQHDSNCTHGCNHTTDYLTNQTEEKSIRDKPQHTDSLNINTNNAYLDDILINQDPSENLRLLISGEREPISAAYGANSIYNSLASLGLQPGYTKRSVDDSIWCKYAAGAFSLSPLQHIPKIIPELFDHDICSGGDNSSAIESKLSGQVGKSAEFSADQLNNCNANVDDDGTLLLTDLVNKEYVSGFHEGLSRDSSHCIAETFCDRMESLNRVGEAFRTLIEKAVGPLPVNSGNIGDDETNAVNDNETALRGTPINYEDGLANISHRGFRCYDEENEDNFNNMNNKELINFRVKNKCSIVHTSNYTDLNQYTLNKLQSDSNHNTNNNNSTDKLKTKTHNPVYTSEVMKGVLSSLDNSSPKMIPDTDKSEKSHTGNSSNEKKNQTLKIRASKESHPYMKIYKKISSEINDNPKTGLVKDKTVEITPSSANQVGTSLLVTSGHNCNSDSKIIVLKSNDSVRHNNNKRRDSYVQKEFIDSDGKPIKFKMKGDNSAPRMSINSISKKTYAREMTKPDITPKIIQQEDPGISGYDFIIGMDMKNCECRTVLNDIYPQAIRHWKLSGETGQALNILLDAGSAAIYVRDFVQALAYLEESAEAIKRLKVQEDPFDLGVPNQEGYTCTKWEEAKCYNLLGQALYEVDRTKESMIAFSTSLQLLGCTQRFGASQSYSWIIRQLLKQWLHRNWPANRLGQAREAEMIFLTDMSECLSYLFRYQNNHGNKWLCLMTALQQVNNAEVALLSYKQLIVAYTTMMECCLLFLKHDTAIYYENKATTRCKEIRACAVLEDINSVINFYASAMRVRMYFGDIDIAIKRGNVAKEMILKLNDESHLAVFFPQLAFLYFINNGLVECSNLLESIEKCAIITKNIIAETYYYALCFDLILDTGFKLCSPFECIDFANKVTGNNIFRIKPHSFYYLASCVALWYERTKNTELSRQWYNKAVAVTPSHENIIMIQGYSKLLECRFIRLNDIISGCNSHVINDYKKDNKKEMSRLWGIVKQVPVMSSRVERLRAHQSMVNHSNQNAKRCINRSMVQSKSKSLKMEYNIAHRFQVGWFPARDTRMQNTNQWMNNVMNETIPNINDIDNFNQVDVLYLPPVCGRSN